MTMINTFIIDLERSELVLDPLTDHDLLAQRPPIVIDDMTGPIVVVSADRMAALELMVFADLNPGDDIIQLDDPCDLARHIASGKVMPALVLASAALVINTEVVLDQHGRHDVAVIAL